jgi:hypothetical protein
MMLQAVIMFLQSSCTTWFCNPYDDVIVNRSHVEMTQVGAEAARPQLENLQQYTKALNVTWQGRHWMYWLD